LVVVGIELLLLLTHSLIELALLKLFYLSTKCSINSLYEKIIAI